MYRFKFVIFDPSARDRQPIAGFQSHIEAFEYCERGGADCDIEYRDRVFAYDSTTGATEEAAKLHLKEFQAWVLKR